MPGGGFVPRHRRVADIAERYGWVNRSIPDDQLDGFVDHLARRIVSYENMTEGSRSALIVGARCEPWSRRSLRLVLRTRRL